MIEPILVVGIVILVTVWITRHRWRKRAERIALRHTTGLELLAKRYARGDIDRDEYLEKRDDILNAAGALRQDHS